MKHVSIARHGGRVTSHVAAGFELDESIYAPGLRMPVHAHERASFSLIIEGAFAERVGRRVWARTPATIIFRPPGVEHAVI